jgi:hypothetical protein
MLEHDEEADLPSFVPYCGATELLAPILPFGISANMVMRKGRGEERMSTAKSILLPSLRLSFASTFPIHRPLGVIDERREVRFSAATAT